MKIGRLEVDGGFILLVALMFLLDNSGLLLPLMISAAVHEIGHYVFIKLFGGQVLLLKLEFVGLNMEYEGLNISYWKEVLIAISGPVFSLALALAAAVYGKNTGNQEAYYLAGVSLVLGIFNSMPVKQLDGGRALYMFVAWLFGIGIAEIVVCAVSCITIFLLLTGGAIMLIYTKWNFTLLAFAVWLLVSYCKRERDGIKYNPYTRKENY